MRLKRGGWKTQACSSTHAKEGYASSSSQHGSSPGWTVEIGSPWPSQHESLQPWRNFVAGWDTVLMERHHLPSRIDTTEETPLLKVPTVVWCCGTTVSIGMFCSSLLAQPGSNYGSTRYRVVPGTAAHAERTRTCWSTEYYDYCRFLLPAPYIGFACFSLQVLLYSYLPLQQQQLSVFFMLYSILHSCFAGLYVLLYMLNCCTAVSAALRRSCLRHLFLAPSLRAPVRTAAVYVPI